MKECLNKTWRLLISSVCWVTAVSAGLILLGGLWLAIMTTDEPAAWTQAVGSILAILGAFGIAHWQHRLEANRLITERHHRQSDYLSSIAAIVDSCYRSIEEAREITVQNVDEDTVLDQFTRLLPRMKLIFTALSEVPAHTLQDYALTMSLLDLRRVMEDVIASTAAILNESGAWVDFHKELEGSVATATSAQDAFQKELKSLGRESRA